MSSMQNILYCEPGRIFCRSKRVLLAVDGSDRAARAASVAFEIAEMTGSKIHIIHVIPTASVQQIALMTDGDIEEIKRKYSENGRRLLEGYKKAAEDYHLEVELILEEGRPANRIVLYANENEIDLVVMGSRGPRTGKRVDMGSETERVVEGTECPVIIV
ncbi:MAG: universal stress protein [Candidatus Thorarchaeota archaeon]